MLLKGSAYDKGCLKETKIPTKCKINCYASPAPATPSSTADNALKAETQALVCILTKTVVS